MTKKKEKTPQVVAAQGQQTPNVKKNKKQTNLQEMMAQAEQTNVLVHRRGLAKEQLQLDEAEVRHYIKKVEAAHNDLHEKILALVHVDDREEHDQHYVQFDELQDEISIKLEEQLAKCSATAFASRATFAPSQPHAPILVHQPLKIPIPTFDGRYESWPKFKNTPDPPAVKLYHLDKALTGSAAGIIDAKTISEGNYNHAWEILEERYENKRHAIDKHIHGLLNLKRMSRGTYDELRKLLDECSKHVESLKFLQQEFLGVSELILVHVLASALDKDIRRRWEHTVKHGDLPGLNSVINRTT
ncbi:uncharacterized protein LOC134222506 [Armigeres subalbatus]|uniref:uncharacterized protein LOC134222506 n=1 Tax=Armigeres subalbatus TaxID=124917 RepID=UPI002ED61434